MQSQQEMFSDYPMTRNKEILSIELGKRYLAMEKLTIEMDKIQKEIDCIIDRGEQVFDDGENIE